VCAAAGFQPNQARRPLGKVREHFAPPQLLAEHDFAVGIHPVYLKTALGDI
jgi:hypothetical protein